jgi:Domain of unknown function (DUF222)
MLPEPIPDREPDEEPDGSSRPDEEWDGPEQGLFVCLPAEELTLEGFAQDGRADTMEPGPLLATVVDAVTGDDARGLTGLSDDQLTGIISAAQRLESRVTWTRLAALAEYAARRPASRDKGDRRTGAPAGPEGISVFAADELARDLHSTWQSTADQMAYAKAVTERLPLTFAALGAGRIHPVHLRIIEDETRILTDADAAKADAFLAGAAPGMTFGEVRYAAHRLVLKLDPEAAQRRKEAARRETHVRPFREASGNAGMVGREMPSDEVLASWQHVEQRALDLRAAGLPGTLRELRVQAYLDLLQERDSRTTANPAGNDHSGRNADPGPSLAAQVTITVPLTTVTGQSSTPGEADGFGLLDAEDARALVAAAARHPNTRWCLTALNPDGTAAAHACAAGRHCWSADQSAADFLRALNLTLTPVVRGPCDHTQAEDRYRPSRALRHLVNARNTRCTAPGCGRPAARCDEDHTTPWHHGGLTCPCNIAPLCRHHHRCKQAEGWWLEQPEPGVLKWRVPSGRTFATAPTIYPL